MRRLAIAIGFLTRLPVPRVAATPEDFAAAARLYPLAGLAVGAVAAAAGWAGATIDPWAGALAALAGWVWGTGALHLDGLGDLADGLGAAHGRRDRLLAVMVDPHVGSFAVVAIGMQLLAKLVLLHAILDATAVPFWIVLPAVAATARAAPLAWARWLPPLRPGGLGAAIAGAVRRRDLIGWGALLAAAGAGLPPLLVLPPLAAGLGLWFRRRLGGVTGDVHGAGIELAETGLLIAFTAWPG